MPIITKPQSIVKGEDNIITLDKDNLADHASVIADSYFSDQDNWSRVYIQYRSEEGGQKNLVVFDATQEEPEGSFDPSERARDGDWTVVSLIIHDFDGGRLVINRGDLDEEDFDLFISVIIEIDIDFINNAVVDGTTPRFNSTVFSTAIQSDGKTLVGGFFTNYGQSGVSNLTRLNADGTLDTDFINNAVVDGTTARFNGNIRSIAIQSDGKILTGGEFIDYDNQTGVNRLIRLNADGTLDTDFRDNAVVDGATPRFNDFVSTIAIQSDGKILVGGNFTNYDGQTGVNRLVRLNADGTLDTDFRDNAVVNGTTPRFSGEVQSIAIQSDGKILVGGGFISYDGQSGVGHLIRLNADGTLDTDFRDNVVFNNFVSTIAIQSDGKILVGGNFTNYDGQTGVDRLVRLNADGTLDTDFINNAVVNGTTPRFGSTIRSIAMQSNGKIIVGGQFTNYSGQTGVNLLVGLNANGTLDTNFIDDIVVDGTTARFNSTIRSIAIQSGNIIVGGQFTNYSGQTGVSYLIRLQ